MIVEILAKIGISLGTLFILIAAIGILRLPDIYMRMHASAKSSSLGLSLLLIGISVQFPEWPVIIKTILIICIIFITAPLSGHMISRVAHLLKIPKWKNTVKDDLDKIDAE